MSTYKKCTTPSTPAKGVQIRKPVVGTICEGCAHYRPPSPHEDRISVLGACAWPEDTWPAPVIDYLRRTLRDTYDDPIELGSPNIYEFPLVCSARRFRTVEGWDR